MHRAQLYVLRLMNARVAENPMTGKSAETVGHDIWRGGGGGAWARRFIAAFNSSHRMDRGAGAGGGEKGLKCDV